MRGLLVLGKNTARQNALYYGKREPSGASAGEESSSAVDSLADLEPLTALRLQILRGFAGFFPRYSADASPDTPDTLRIRGGPAAEASSGQVSNMTPESSRLPKRGLCCSPQPALTPLPPPRIRTLNGRRVRLTHPTCPRSQT